MGIFNESFYTTDFDQEMMDFVESRYKASERQWNLDGDELVYGKGNGYFWTNSFPHNGSARDFIWETPMTLTKQEFKEKIGMPQDNIAEEGTTFGKKDLVDGMFVKTREGEIHVVIGDSAHDITGYLDLGNSDLDIVEVFIKEKNYSLIKHLNGVGLKSIWKRTPPKTEKVIKLEERISIMQDNLLALKEQLEEELTL